MEENQIHDAKISKTCMDSKKLYICTHEASLGWRTAFVVRVIELGELLRSAQLPLMPTARRLTVLPGSESHLPSFGGCCVLGSKIYFAGGITPMEEGTNRFPFDPPCQFVWSFDTNDPRHEIIRLPKTLNLGKESPLMFEFSGKIYILGTNRSVDNFEVFDPDMDTWLALPTYWHPASGIFPFSYCFVGSKLFVCNQFCKYMMSDDQNFYKNDERMNVISFDLSDKDAQWKPVPSMCKGEPFPFIGQGLVLDVEQLDPNEKLLFALEMNDHMLLNKLVVYIMSLDKDEEYITPVYQRELPTEFHHVVGVHHFFHLGGNHICLVNCSAYDYGSEPSGTLGAAVPFKFDIIKENENEHSKYSINVISQPACRFGYEGLPESESAVDDLTCMIGCFLL